MSSTDLSASESSVVPSEKEISDAADTIDKNEEEKAMKEGEANYKPMEFLDVEALRTKAMQLCTLCEGDIPEGYEMKKEKKGVSLALKEGENGAVHFRFRQLIRCTPAEACSMTKRQFHNTAPKEIRDPYINEHIFAKDPAISDPSDPECETFVIYTSSKGMGPMKGRDFVTFSTMQQESEDLFKYGVFTIDHKDYPPTKKCIRAQLDAAYVFKKVSPYETEVVSYFYMNMRGSIPKLIYKLMTGQMYDLAKKFRGVVEKESIYVETPKERKAREKAEKQERKSSNRPS